MHFARSIGSAWVALLLTAAAAWPASLTIPAGAAISIRMTDALESSRNHAGETFRATLDAPLMVEGKIVVPRGAEAIGRVTEVQPSGRFKGRPMIAVELTALNFGGKSVAIRTSAYQQGGTARGKQTAKVTAGATAIGTVVGMMGGAPWLGTGLGAAAGLIVQTVRGPGQIHIPAESLLIFTLQSPLPLEGGM